MALADNRPLKSTINPGPDDDLRASLLVGPGTQVPVPCR